MSQQSDNRNYPKQLKQNLLQKVKIIRRVQQQKQQNLSYSDVLYLIDYPRLKYNFIKICLCYLYAHQYQQYNSGWKDKFEDSKIVSDYLVISRKMIEQPWIESEVNHRNQQQKEMQFQKYQYKSKTKEQIKQKIKNLKDQLKIMSGHIDITRSQNQSLNLRQKYTKILQQYNFWRNKPWKLSHLKQLKAANQQADVDTVKLDAINRIIEQQMKEFQRAKQVQILCQAKRFKQPLNTYQNTMDSKNSIKLNNLQQIFQSYAKKQIRQSMFFGQMMNSAKNISLQNFLRLINDSGTASLLTLQQRVKIFKQNSQYDKKVNFIVFTNILQQICRKLCDKLGVKFSSKILNAYIQDLIKKIRSKSKSKYLEASIPDQYPQKSHEINNLRGNIITNYHYRTRSHTGKYKEDIEEHVRRRKRQKNKKTLHNLQRSQHSKSPQKINQSRNESNVQPKIKLKTDIAQSFVYRNNQITKNQQAAIKQDDRSLQKKITYLTKEENSYSKVFYKKLLSYNRNRKIKTQFQKIKTKQGQYMTPKQKPILNKVLKSPVVKTNDFHYEQGANAMSLQQNKDLNSIIKLQEDDFFLTTHLQSLQTKAKDIQKLINQSKYNKPQ